MARKLREQFAGATLHVWNRRVDRWSLFVDEADYRQYMLLLADTVLRFDLILVSFCLMPNHVHLLVTLRERNIDKAMHHLHGEYVPWFNARHDRDGRLFERRYQSKVVKDELYFVTAKRYIEMNPVEAALCRRPEDWPWSTCGLAHDDAAPAWLVRRLCPNRKLKEGDRPRF